MSEEKKKHKKMTDGELQDTLATIIEDSQDYAEGELASMRAKATDYYNAEKLGNEEDGRSQFVVSEVRDAVTGVIPSILRVVFGAEKAVEFAPRNAETVAQAEQATDVIQYDFVEANGGFMQSLAVLKDGLIRKIGVFKYWWDDTSSTEAHKIVGIPESKLEALVAEEGVELLRVVGNTPGTLAAPQIMGPDGQPMGEPQVATEPTYDVEFTYTEKNGRARVEAIPPEEFLFNREARSLDDALFIGHQRNLTRSELISLGIDEETIEAHGGEDAELRDSEEAIARQPTDDGTMPDPEAGEENEKHLYVEGYVRIDYDGDGIAELRRVCTIGHKFFPVSNDPVDSVPFAIFCPDPEPHTMLGQSWADRTMDLQLVKTMLTRTTLDSLALSIFPRMAYVEGQANPTDILNTEIGAPIRMRTIGAVQALTVPFVGKEAFPMFEYFDQITERRIGRMSNGAALDMDALQSSTKSAVGAAITSAQEQTELLARIFAEGTLKPLFRGMLKLYVANQPKARTMRLRGGQWAEIDFRTWDADMDVIVNVAIGNGPMEQKLSALAELTAKQEQLLATMGPTNPIFTMANYSNTIKETLKLLGIKDSRPFIQDVDPNWQPPAPPEPPKSPEQVIAEAQLQIEQMRTQRELQIKEAELTLRQEDQKTKHDIELRKLDLEMQLKKYEIDLKYQLEQMKASIDAQSRNIENDLAAMDSERDHEIAARQVEHQEAVMEHNQMLKQQEHEKKMSEPPAGSESTSE